MRLIAIFLIFAFSLEGGKISILATSDLQSNLVSFRTKQKEVGGLPRIATVKKRFKEGGGSVFLVSTGDDLFGPFYSIFHGKPEYKAMFMTGYDIVCPGNHEFDYGLSIFRDAVSAAGFEIVCSNIKFQDPLLKQKILPWTIKKVGDLRIGFFGLITPQLFKVANPGEGLILDKNIVEVARRTVEALKGQGCNLIVALTHLGFDSDREIARKVAGIDIIIGGHDHEVIFRKVGKTYILHAGARGRYVASLTFEYDGGIKDPVWSLIEVDSTIPPDSVVLAYVQQVWKSYDRELNTPIGYSKVPLDARKSAVRTRESNLGDLIADSWISWFEDADVALVSGGSIRGDRIFPPGPVTYRMINDILPFRNEIMEVELTGDELKQVLEISASALRVKGDGVPDSCRASTGGFLQVSGLRVVFDTTKPSFSAIYDGRKVKKITNPGSRVVKVLVRKNGVWQGLESDQKYRVLINKWMSKGGDGYFVFVGKKVKNTTVITADALIKYVKMKRTLKQHTEGRIKIIP